MGLADTARHVVGCQLTQGTRVGKGVAGHFEQFVAGPAVVQSVEEVRGGGGAVHVHALHELQREVREAVDDRQPHVAVDVVRVRALALGVGAQVEIESNLSY